MSKDKLTTQYNAVVVQNQSLQQEIMQYRKIIGEVKEIAEDSTNAPCLDVVDCSECANCNDECTDYGESCMQYGLYKILQKCEVLINGYKGT